MALGNVYMTDVDGNIGSKITSSSEKTCGLLFDISAHPDFWSQGQGQVAEEILRDNVIELNNLEDAIKAGIIERTENSDLLEGIPHYHIKQFFKQTGGTGRLFVMFADCSKNWDAIIDMQKAASGTISQFGVWTEQHLWTKMDEHADQYSMAIVGDLQVIGEQMANEHFAPASIILSANTSKVKTAEGEEDKIVFSQIPSCISNARYVSVLLSQSMDITIRQMQGALKSTTPVGVLGIALGTLAKARVGESIAWVGAFDLKNSISTIEMGFGDAALNPEGLLTNAIRYQSLSKTQLDDLDTKGYMFVRTYAGLEGHTYFSKDQTCSNGDYCTIARNRAINKSRRVVRQALLPYVNSPVKVDPANGNLSSSQATVYVNLITDVLTAMEQAEEISGIGAVNVPVEQNILKTKQLNLSYSLIPLGCAESIKVLEGLAISR